MRKIGISGAYSKQFRGYACSSGHLLFYARFRCPVLLVFPKVLNAQWTQEQETHAYDARWPKIVANFATKRPLLFVLGMKLKTDTKIDTDRRPNEGTCRWQNEIEKR